GEQLRSGYVAEAPQVRGNTMDHGVTARLFTRRRHIPVRENLRRLDVARERRERDLDANALLRRVDVSDVELEWFRSELCRIAANLMRGAAERRDATSRGVLGDENAILALGNQALRETRRQYQRDDGAGDVRP